MEPRQGGPTAVRRQEEAIRRPPKAVVVLLTLIWVRFAPVLNKEL